MAGHNWSRFSEDAPPVRSHATFQKPFTIPEFDEMDALAGTGQGGVASAAVGKDDLTLPGDPPIREGFPGQIGSYKILRCIGRGGMGAVYEAIQAQPRRRVALKLIRSDQMSAELLRRFSIEVQALGRVHHAGIARIYDGGTADIGSGPQPYFVMELVEGLPLDEHVSKHNSGIRDCVTLMIRVADAVHHAHQQDVIHRDLKPANILVDETGQPKILDFGVARMTSIEEASVDVATHTQVGVLVGTLPYMSPEQTEAVPDHFDQRSDVYALGVITYKLLAGRLPYQFAGGFIEAINIIQDTTPEGLGDIDARLRGDLETVVSKALAKERKHRYQTAQAFADDLRRVVNGLPISVVPTTLSAKIRRWTLREENIRWAGWAGVIGYSLVSLFESVYLCTGLIAWFWWAPFLPRDIRYTEFILNEMGWTTLLALLAWVNWRVTSLHIPSMWLALCGSVLIAGFAASVLLGSYLYDFGGALRDPVFRTALFMLFTLLALLGVLMSLLALITAYRLRQWDRPPIPHGPHTLLD